MADFEEYKINQSDGFGLKGLVISLVIAMTLGVLIALFISRLGPLGHYIPSGHITTDYFVGLLWGIVIAVFLTSFPVTVEERKVLIILWGVRCCVTLFAMLFYEYNYPLDAYGYYETSLQRGFDLSSVGFGHGTENIEAVCWILNHYLPIMDSFHALKVVFSFIGFMGTYFAYLGFTMLLGRPDQKLLLLLFLFPSMLFWSSILGKDPINLLGITLYVFGTIGFTKQGRLTFLIPMVFGIALATLIRSWNLAILVLPLASLGIRGIKKPALRFLFIGAIAGAAIFSIRMFADQFGVENSSDLINRTQSLSHSWNGGGSGRNAPEFASLTGMLKFAPLGMFTALFRPLPGEIMNPFGLLAGFENLFLLIFIFRSLKKIFSNKKHLYQPQVTWAVTLILIWSFVYSFVSFQNLGSAIRFRLQILPVMLCLLFYLTSDAEDPEDVRHSGAY
jgi:hypothetical protein